ncbi:hypothetical protein RFI_27232 [Reticulomyxa filosa]|uniref:Uncharacterized protein n=1 Tax=Reticulomyxa filosa TaxID=46433 RepID=X6M910_RETFI|nr:hypothetical protein RFI_27232 [Reticulomyxa filosa]|eukprot:ETO10146.1 hypothetical protein RFI_27232 [Reticulomyxa filosa]
MLQTKKNFEQKRNCWKSNYKYMAIINPLSKMTDILSVKSISNIFGAQQATVFLRYPNKLKGVTIYLFSDLFLWASVRGKYKGSYSLYDKDLQITKSGKEGDADFSIGLKLEKSKRTIVCANDEQRDLIMETVIDAFQKCQLRAKNASYVVFFLKW